MPAYGIPSYMISLSPGDSLDVIVTTDAIQGAGVIATSRAVALKQSPGGNTTPFSVNIRFSGAPGAFTWDVECADIDVDGAYSKQGSITTVNGVNANYADFPNVNARFVRIRNTTPPANAVTGIVTVKR